MRTVYSGRLLKEPLSFDRLRMSGSLSNLLLLAALFGCAPAGSQGGPPGESPAPPRDRTLVMVSYGEPPHFGTKLGGVGGGGGSGNSVRAPFIAALADRDDQGIARPQLAEKLPEVGTDSWLVFPDGRMETTYRLRPGLTWHDGKPLTPEDFAFAARVYAIPETGAGPSPQNVLEEILAPDDRTVVFRWRQPTVRAGALDRNTGGFPPLPRHILEEPFRQGDVKAFLALPYWSREYAGLGPYRLEHWEPGAFIEGRAFDGYALGRPKIGRIRIVFNGNHDAVLATLLAGGADATMGDSTGFAHGLILKQQWQASGSGVVLASTTDVRYVQIQHKQEVINPRALLDLRVRRALAHAIDRQALVDGLMDGQGLAADAYMAPEHPHYAETDRVIAKYPYDPRRTEQLLSEAGLVRQGDGFYQGATREPFHLQIQSDTEKELVILVDSLRRSGISAGIDLLTPALVSDRALQTLYPALSIRQNHFEVIAFFENFTTGRIASEQTRWTGSNRGGYSNPEYDRLFQTQSASLDEAERARLDVSLARFISEELPGIPIYYRVQFDAHVSALRGPTPYPSDSSRTWNIHQWAWAS